MKQRTIAEAVSFNGIGLHTGNLTTVTFKPAPADTGIVFYRTDVEGSPAIPALVDVACQTQNPGQAHLALTCMEKILRRLKPEAHPVLIQLPQREYERIRDPWELP